MREITSGNLPGLPRRALDAHKGSAGGVLVVGGSWGMAGAAHLAAEGAISSGAGYVRVACPECVYPILAALSPSAVFVPLACDRERRVVPGEAGKVLAAAGLSRSAVVGVGLGEAPAEEEFFARLIEGLALPCVIDASALSLLASRPELLAALSASSVLTPHPGEAGGLLGKTAGEINAARRKSVEELAGRTGAVVVLKGARTLVCDGTSVYENTTGNAGMACAGMGDVLSGVIASFVAQGMGAFDAAALGVWVHGKAGDLAAHALGRGLRPRDVVDRVPEALGLRERRGFERGGRD